ncbi:MAG: FecR domain-containing protein [Sphingomonas sp.]|uniref:FecR domain-containing protein n=1 Tax=Sphingomonas sp. TaxID=28214 RepID=UPI00356B5277
MLSFDQAKLADVAAEFNRYNDHKLVIADSNAAAIRIGGTFQASNVQVFARLLRDAYGLRIDRMGDEVTISS